MTNNNDEPVAVLARLYATIASRKGADPATSHTAALYAKGREKICEKVGEEAVETVVAGLAQDDQALIGESADLLYHLMVLWADRGIDPDAVWRALAAREGTSGVAEKASRTKEP